MKILIIRNFPSYMAVKNNTYNIQEVGLAKALVRKGHICDIVFWTNKQEETVEIPVDNVGTVHVFYKHGRTRLKNTVFNDCDELFARYDILQPCEYNQMQSWILAKKQPNKTVIYHGPYYSPFNKRYNLMCKVFDAVFLKQYIKQGTQFIVKSKMAKGFLVAKGIEADNVQPVGVGIDAQMLSDNQQACCEPIYKSMIEDDAEIKLLYVGRFEERRNIPFIVDVFKKVLESNPQTRLYMIGTGKEEYVNSAFDYMEKLGVRNKVVWQEKMEQKYLSNIYKLADCFILPTEYEIFGMVLLEAMYYGTVVLTTNNGGSSTLINSGENGFVFEDKDAEQWANCILQMQSNQTQSNTIKQNAAKTVQDNFTWDTLADEFIKQYSRRLRI